MLNLLCRFNSRLECKIKLKKSDCKAAFWCALLPQCQSVPDDGPLQSPARPDPPVTMFLGNDVMFTSDQIGILESAGFDTTGFLTDNTARIGKWKKKKNRQNALKGNGFHL